MNGTTFESVKMRTFQSVLNWELLYWNRPLNHLRESRHIALISNKRRKQKTELILIECFLYNLELFFFSFLSFSVAFSFRNGLFGFDKRKNRSQCWETTKGNRETERHWNRQTKHKHTQIEVQGEWTHNCKLQSFATTEPNFFLSLLFLCAVIFPLIK